MQVYTRWEIILGYFLRIKNKIKMIICQENAVEFYLRFCDIHSLKVT